MVNYPPYVDAYGKIKELFKKIEEAAVPPKFTTDFMYSKLGLKSTSFRAMVPLLKKLGFIDEANVPTQNYKDYREPSLSKYTMGVAVKKAYAELYSAAEYAHSLSKQDLMNKLITITGTAKEDKIIPKVTGSFMELCALSNFDLEEPPRKEEKETALESESSEKSTHSSSISTKLGISYTINLNLPATSDVEVFNAIFKSLKENLLK